MPHDGLNRMHRTGPRDTRHLKLLKYYSVQVVLNKPYTMTERHNINYSFVSKDHKRVVMVSRI